MDYLKAAISVSFFVFQIFSHLLHAVSDWLLLITDDNNMITSIMS